MSDRVRSQSLGPPAFVPTIGLREVLDGSPDLVFSTDRWGRLVWASPAFEPLTGRRVKDCVGDSVLALLSPAHAREAKRAFARARRRSPEPVDLALELVKPDGRTIAVDARVRFAENSAGSNMPSFIEHENSSLPAPMM